MSRILCALASLTLLALLSNQATAAGHGGQVNGGGYNRTGEDRRTFTVSATMSGGSFALLHVHGSEVGGRFVGNVTCLDVAGNVATFSGTITDGQERPGQGGASLGGRMFRAKVTDGQPDTFEFQIGKPGQAYAACSAPDPDTGKVLGPLSVETGNYTVGQNAPAMPNTGGGGTAPAQGIPTAAAAALPVLITAVYALLRRRACSTSS